MQNRYRIAWDFTGWAVIDTLFGCLAEADGHPLFGLSGERADQVCRALNESRPSAEHQGYGSRAA